MDRKQFIKTCGFSCLALTGLSVVLTACASNTYIQSTAENNVLKVSKTDFISARNKVKRHVIIKAQTQDYPIVVYRFSENDYTALLLQCTHQQAELNVSGDLLSCSAHGSEFNNKGQVTQGPAEHALKQYNVTNTADHIYIHLT